MGDFYNKIRHDRKHYVGIDCLRGIAAFFIVGCHIGLSDRTASGMALTHFCDLNVGVFAAISGFLLYASVAEGSSTNIIKRILGKRIGRLLPMYVIWSLFYLIVRFGTEFVFGRGGFSQDCAQGLSFWGWVVFGGGAACTLWFLINLLYAQITICLFYRMVPRLLNNVWFVALCALAMLRWSVVDHGYLGYYTARLFSLVFLGWSIALCRRKMSACFWGWAMIAIASLAAHFFIGFIPRFVRDFVCVVPILMCAISFVGDKFSGMMGDGLASTSMGVYLWHPLFVVGFQRIISKMVSAPYSVDVLLLAWVGTYFFALVATILTGKSPLRRFQA